MPRFYFPRKTGLWVLLLALLLSSCALPPEDQFGTGTAGPNDPGSSAPLATAGSIQSPDTANDSTIAPPTTLQSLAREQCVPFRACVEQALKHNLKVHIAQLNSASARQGETVAAAEFDPRFNVNGLTYADDDRSVTGQDGNASVSKKFITGAELRVEAGTAFGSGSGRGLDYAPNGTEHVIRLRQPLLRGAGIAINRAPQDLARIVTRSSNAMERAEVMEMLRATETAYWTTVWAREALQAQRESLARSELMVKEVQARHQLGASTKIDQLEAAAAAASAREKVERASQRYSDSVANLTYLLGLAPGSVPEGLVFEQLKLPPQPQIDAEACYQQALLQNPQETLLANEVERWTIQSKVARNSVLPELNLELSRGTSGLLGFDNPNINTGASGWSAFLQVSIPWTSRAERAQAEQAKLQLERSQVAREDGRRQLRRDIYEAVREIASGRLQYDAAAEGMQVNQAKWNEQIQRHKEGLVSVRDLREAEGELQQASLNALTAQLGILVADARLARLDGSILERHALTF